MYIGLLRTISFPVSQLITTETSIPCLIPQCYDNRHLGGYNAGIPDVILGLWPWSCCSSNPFTIGQLEQVGWPHLLYETQNTIGRELADGLKVCSRFIFLLFACLNNRPMSAGKEEFRNGFLKMGCYFSSFFWSIRGPCRRSRILRYHP